MAAYDITTASAALNFDTALGQWHSCIAIDGNHFINFYQGVDTVSGYAQVFSINTSTWAVTTASTRLEFNTASGNSNSCAQIDANHFINFSRIGVVDVFTVNTTTWAVTTATTTLSFDTNYGYLHQCAAIDSNHFLNIWNSGATGDGFVQVFSINTSTWAVTTANSSLEFDTQNMSGGSIAKIDANHFICSWRGGANNDGYAQVFTVNTTTWAVTTANNALLVCDTNNYSIGSMVRMVDANHAINFTFGRAVEGRLYAETFTINTSTWAVTTASDPFQIQASTGGDNNSCYQVDTNHFINFWKGIDDDGFCEVVTVNTSTWAVTTSAAALEFDTAQGAYNSVAKIDTTHFVNCWKGASNNGYAQIFTVAVLNAYTVSLTETLTESETLTKFRGLKKSFTETFTETDILTKSQKYLKTLSDTFTESEVAKDTVVLADSYSESNAGLLRATRNDGIKATGQSFTTTGGILSSCKFFLYKSGSPTGDCYAKIYAHSGEYGTSSVPTGTALAISDVVDISTIPVDAGIPLNHGTLVTFTFSGLNKINLINGIQYVLVFDLGGSVTDPSNCVIIGIDNTTPSHQGNLSNFTSSWVAESGQDLCFYVYTSTILTFVSYLKTLSETFTQTEELVLSYIAKKTLELIEAIGLTDTVTKAQTYIKSLIDTFTQSDTVTHLAMWLKSLTESFSFTDILTVAKTYILNLSDSIGFTDTITSLRSWILSLSESTSITDYISTKATYIKSLVDTFTESDAITKAKSFFLNLTESIATFDTLTKLQGFVKTLDETFAVSDNLSRLGSYLKTLTETFTESDSLTTLKSIILSLSESIGLTDTITKVATYSKTFLESTSITDTLSAKANYLKSLVETFTESDTVTKLLTRFANLSESIGLTDTLTKAVTWIKNLSETTWMSEILKTSGNWWNELTKHTSTWTDGTKHSSSYTNSTKHTSSWTNRNKLS